MKEYKVVIYREGLISSLMFGEAKTDPKNFTEFLNDHARDGWRVITLEREVRRAMLVKHREAFLVVLERDVRE